MIVARSAAAREVLRCSACSSVTPPPSAVSRWMSSISQSCFKPVSPPRTLVIMSACLARFGEYGRGARVAEDPFDLLGR